MHLFVVCGIFMVLFSACHRKQIQVDSGKSDTDNTQRMVKDKSHPMAEPPLEEAYQVAGLQKTVCFGKCPAFEVKFYSDGRVTWYGHSNVQRMGWYETRVDSAILKAIRDKAFEVNFFDFHNEYPTGVKIADLPSVITYLRVGDMEKQVKNTHDAPEELRLYEQFLEELIEQLPWKPAGE